MCNLNLFKVVFSHEISLQEEGGTSLARLDLKPRKTTYKELGMPVMQCLSCRTTVGNTSVSTFLPYSMLKSSAVDRKWACSLNHIWKSDQWRLGFDSPCCLGHQAHNRDLTHFFKWLHCVSFWFIMCISEFSYVITYCGQNSIS